MAERRRLAYCEWRDTDGVRQRCWTQTTSVTGFCQEHRKTKKPGAGTASTDGKTARGTSPDAGSTPDSSTVEVLWEDLEDLKERVKALEATVKALESTVAVLQASSITWNPAAFPSIPDTSVTPGWTSGWTDSSGIWHSY